MSNRVEVSNLYDAAVEIRDGVNDRLDELTAAVEWPFNRRDLAALFYLHALIGRANQVELHQMLADTSTAQEVCRTALRLGGIFNDEACKLDLGALKRAVSEEGKGAP